MGDDCESFAGIVRDVVGESLCHFIREGDSVVEFWLEEGKISNVGDVSIFLSPKCCASGFEICYIMP